MNGIQYNCVIDLSKYSIVRGKNRSYISLWQLTLEQLHATHTERCVLNNGDVPPK